MHVDYWSLCLRSRSKRFCIPVTPTVNVRSQTCRLESSGAWLGPSLPIRWRHPAPPGMQHVPSGSSYNINIPMYMYILYIFMGLGFLHYIYLYINMYIYIYISIYIYIYIYTCMYICTNKSRRIENYTRHSILTLYLLYPLVICYIASETGHRKLVSFSH